ncbi:hypothetical protein SDJN02_13808, partial [Cucurbita argyrosperma subsp. argyrosperma]
MAWRSGQSERVLGILPVNLFSQAKNKCKFLRLPTETGSRPILFGMVPFRRFSETSRITSSSQSPISSGIDSSNNIPIDEGRAPKIPVSARPNMTKLLQFPISIGNLPSRSLFPPALKRLSFCNIPMLFGISPLISLSASLRYTRFERFPIVNDITRVLKNLRAWKFDGNVPRKSSDARVISSTYPWELQTTPNHEHGVGSSGFHVLKASVELVRLLFHEKKKKKNRGAFHVSCSIREYVDATIEKNRKIRGFGLIDLSTLEKPSRSWP